MTTRPTISEEELSAFIDGELDAEARTAVEASLAANAVLAGHAAQLESDKRRLKDIYGPLAARPLPENWRVRIESRTQPSWSRLSYGTIAAVAATLLVAAGLFSLWPQGPDSGGHDVIAEALNVRSDAVHPAAVIDIVSPQEASTAVSNALHVRFEAPDYSHLGYALKRVQIYAGAPGARPVELVYRNAQMRDVTLYVRRPVHALPANAQAIPVQMLPKGDLYVCAWQGETLDAVVAGKMSGREMLRVASASYSLPL